MRVWVSGALALLILMETPLLLAAPTIIRPTEHPPEVDKGPPELLEKPLPPQAVLRAKRTSWWLWALGAAAVSAGVAAAAGSKGGGGGSGGASTTGSLVITGPPP